MLNPIAAGAKHPPVKHALLVLALIGLPYIPGGYVARLEALAELQTFNGELLAGDSATETLRRWCAEHRLADPATIRAVRLRGPDKSADASIRAALDAGPGEVVAYRHVDLACGTHVLSRADNWYLPARLTPEMNRALDQTDTPFGVVVRPLGFHRRTLETRWLFEPLPPGWEMSRALATDARAPLAIPEEVLRHRAVLITGAGVPFSVVEETYTGGILAFRPDR